MNEDTNEMEEGVDDDDECLHFVSNTVLKTMKMKHEKWVKMMTTDEYRVSRFNSTHKIVFNSIYSNLLMCISIHTFICIFLNCVLFAFSFFVTIPFSLPTCSFVVASELYLNGV